VQDITARKQVEEELRKANRELDAFVYTVSHDLRSPLTPIIGFAEFLKEHYRDCLDEQAIDILGEIRQQGLRMLELLEDLLVLARAGQLERPDEPVDCCQVVEEVVTGLASKIIAAGVVVQKKSFPSLRVPKTLLAQLFDNLIGNAVRYAGKEGGLVEVGGERSGKQVKLYVRDHGTGIPVEERDRIFDLFYRGSTGKNVEGTGIGLATVQKIAHLYGGRAWVEEPAGGGSIFWVEMMDEVRQEKQWEMEI
jgi:signal transduction histidine kinase